MMGPFRLQSDVAEPPDFALRNFWTSILVRIMASFLGNQIYGPWDVFSFDSPQPQRNQRSRMTARYLSIPRVTVYAHRSMRWSIRPYAAKYTVQMKSQRPRVSHRSTRSLLSASPWNHPHGQQR